MSKLIVSKVSNLTFQRDVTEIAAKPKFSSHIRCDVTCFRDNIIEFVDSKMTEFVVFVCVFFSAACKIYVQNAPRSSYSDLVISNFSLIWFGSMFWVYTHFDLKKKMIYGFFFFVWTVLFILFGCQSWCVCVVCVKSFISRWYLNILTYSMGKTNMNLLVVLRFFFFQPPVPFHAHTARPNRFGNKKDRAHDLVLFRTIDHLS